jgi:hypothetical protein
MFLDQYIYLSLPFLLSPKILLLADVYTNLCLILLGLSMSGMKLVDGGSQGNSLNKATMPPHAPWCTIRPHIIASPSVGQGYTEGTNQRIVLALSWGHQPS